jgi:hypothetical protein
MACSSKTYDITIENGASFSRTLTYKRNDVPVDLSPLTIFGGCRSDYDATSEIFNFDVSVIDVSGGIFAISLPASATALLAGTSSTVKGQKTQYLGVYSLQVSDGVTVTRILEGKVTLSRSGDLA